MSQPFQLKKDYEGDTNENNCNKYYSQSDNDYFVKKWTKNKSINNMMNKKKIFLRLIKQINLK